MLLGLRTVIHPAPDLAAAKQWWTQILGVEPYFDEPFYVGFAVAGYELGLRPDRSSADGVVVYWGVRDIDAALAELNARGAVTHEPVTDVGDGIRVATLHGPAGDLLGLIENPHFAAVAAPPGAGPGR
jgi:predicted enzyme related to lactoylglutathione lyase